MVNFKFFEFGIIKGKALYAQGNTLEMFSLLNVLFTHPQYKRVPESKPKLFKIPLIKLVAYIQARDRKDKRAFLSRQEGQTYSM